MDLSSPFSLVTREQLFAASAALHGANSHNFVLRVTKPLRGIKVSYAIRSKFTDLLVPVDVPVGDYQKGAAYISGPCSKYRISSDSVLWFEKSERDPFIATGMHVPDSGDMNVPYFPLIARGTDTSTSNILWVKVEDLIAYALLVGVHEYKYLPVIDAARREACIAALLQLITVADVVEENIECLYDDACDVVGKTLGFDDYAAELTDEESEKVGNELTTDLLSQAMQRAGLDPALLDI